MKLTIEKSLKEELIFRIMTFDLFQKSPDARKSSNRSRYCAQTKFSLPHTFKFNEQDELVCVGKSLKAEWKTEDFQTYGKATNKLAMMWMKLCDWYATRGNVEDISIMTNARASNTVISTNWLTDLTESANPLHTTLRLLQTVL